MDIFILYYFLGINLIAYAVYMLDKRQAVRGNYRVSENMLLIMVVAGGTIGALSSMLINRHKIKKNTFIIKYILANIFLGYIIYRVFEKNQDLFFSNI